MLLAKKKSLFLVLVIFIMTFLVGCSGGYVANVEMTSPEPKTNASLTYEDDKVKVRFEPVMELYSTYAKFQAMSVVVENKADETLEIVWNKSSFIDFDKTASNLVPGSVKYVDIGKSVPNTIIPRGAKKEIVLIPRDNVSWNDGVDIEPIFYATGVEALKYDGKNLSVILPFKIKEEIEEYRFDFKVNVSQKKPSNSNAQ